jgi:peptidoglycan-N-acetylmuramic acid deacetylase
MSRSPGLLGVLFLLLMLFASCGNQGTGVAEPLVAATPLVIEQAAAVVPTLKPLPTVIVRPTQQPTAQALAPIITSYRPYRIREGDSLGEVSRRGGSTPELIRRYNRLAGEPQVGRELIVPQLQGRGNLLPYRNMMVLKGNTAQPWIALTLDCGSTTSQLPRILDTLRKADAQITFFMVGDMIDDGSVIEQMLAEGHELANHSFTHPDFRELSRKEVIEQLDRTEQVIKRYGGPQATTRPYFRFPYGAYDLRVLRQVIGQGYMAVHWTLDALDTVGQPKTAEFIVERVTTGLPREELGGAIILAHCTEVTADALPAIIERFSAWGFELRTLTEVLGP